MGRAASEATSKDERPNAGASPRPAGASAGLAPMPARNLIPWGDIERRLAERLAANAAQVERKGSAPKPWTHDSERLPVPPASGVRPRDDAREAAGGPDLTYSVYTIAELEARRRARASRLPPPRAPEAQPSRWPDVKRSAAGLLRTLWRGWVRANPRPRVLDVCTIPLQQLLTDFKTALRGVPWTKHAAVFGALLGALVVLLFAILTTAELTDDLKPTRSSLVSTSDEPGGARLAENAPAPSPGEATTAPSEPDPAIEIDDAPAPAPAAKVAFAPRAAGARAKKPGTLLIPASTLVKKKNGELFNP